MTSTIATKIGVGYGKDTNILNARPCNTQASHTNQKTINRWFQRDDDGNDFADER